MGTLLDSKRICFGMTVGLGLMALLMMACSKTEFQREHELALSEKPAVVELEIRTANGKTKYKPGELVEYEELYTSKYSGQWHIETSETFNFMGYAHIARDKLILPSEHISGPNVCCSSKHVWLSIDTTRLPTYRILKNGNPFPDTVNCNCQSYQGSTKYM